MTQMIEESRKDVQIGVGTHPGLVRAKNEDEYGYFEPEDEELFHEKGRLLIVADGMGGEDAGKQASMLTVATISAHYFSHPGDIHSALHDSIQEAVAAVNHFVKRNPALSRAGSTVICLVQQGKQIHVAHVGDSRAYLIRGADIDRLTEDHNAAYQKGVIQEGLSPEEAWQKYPSNELTQAIGANLTSVAPGYQSFGWRDDDILLLSTDGLHGLLNDQEIYHACISTPFSELSRVLIQMANDRGGDDNITVMCLKNAVTPSSIQLPESTAENAGPQLPFQDLGRSASAQSRQSLPPLERFEPENSKSPLKWILLILAGLFLIVFALAYVLGFIQLPNRKPEALFTASGIPDSKLSQPVEDLLKTDISASDDLEYSSEALKKIDREVAFIPKDLSLEKLKESVKSWTEVLISSDSGNLEQRKSLMSKIITYLASVLEYRLNQAKVSIANYNTKDPLFTHSVGIEVREWEEIMTLYNTTLDEFKQTFNSDDFKAPENYLSMRSSFDNLLNKIEQLSNVKKGTESELRWLALQGLWSRNQRNYLKNLPNANDK